tara:strand:- start:13202 stop:13954 length:753 start_codon:yes stop_codon:yes gene_type:complete
MEILFPVNEFESTRRFRAKNHFDFIFGKYRVYVADDQVSLYKALQLRSRVFLQDEDRLDVDEFDVFADHILIEDLEKKQVIGTYRMISDVFSDRFYSETEFDLGDFLQTEGVKIELGRACIHPDYRSGRSIDLLWRGIAAYMTFLNAKYLFGCTSIFLNSKDCLATVAKIKYMQEPMYGIRPLINYPIMASDKQEAELPGLLQSYLRAGAKVVSDPAWDKAWKCADFFTLLDVKDLDKRYQKHYFSRSYI